jgi:hypothetical protein
MLALLIASCDNSVPPTKAPGIADKNPVADQNPQVDNLAPRSAAGVNQPGTLAQG